MRREIRLVQVICLVCCLVAASNGSKAPAGSDGPKGAISTRGPSEAAAKPQVEPERNISVHLANRFHLALVARVMLKVPAGLDLTLEYGGILRSDTGRRTGQRVHGGIGRPLEWTIIGADGMPVFAVEVAPAQTADTRVICRVEDERLYVSVSAIQGGEVSDDEVAKKRGSLGGRSIHDLLLGLEGQADELENGG